MNILERPDQLKAGIKIRNKHTGSIIIVNDARIDGNGRQTIIYTPRGRYTFFYLQGSEIISNKKKIG